MGHTGARSRVQACCSTATRWWNAGTCTWGKRRCGVCGRTCCRSTIAYAGNPQPRSNPYLQQVIRSTSAVRTALQVLKTCRSTLVPAPNPNPRPTKGLGFRLCKARRPSPAAGLRRTACAAAHPASCAVRRRYAQGRTARLARGSGEGAARRGGTAAQPFLPGPGWCPSPSPVKGRGRVQRRVGCNQQEGAALSGRA